MRKPRRVLGPARCVEGAAAAPQGRASQTYRRVVPPERTTDIEVSGNDFASLLDGFSAIGMPAHRRSVARALIEAVAAANSVVEFHWYKSAG